MPWNAPLAVIALLLLLDQPGTLHISTAADPRPPAKTVETGLVVLSAEVNSTGDPGALMVAQGAPPFVEPALDAVRQWTFDTKNVKAPQPINVTILFRSRTVLADRPYMFNVPSEPVTNSPPQPTTIVDPGYPIQSIAEGCVILQMQIDASGRVQKTDVIHDVPSLTPAARQAVSQWRFLPARQNGRAVPGTAVAVLSFLKPVLATG